VELINKTKKRTQQNKQKKTWGVTPQEGKKNKKPLPRNVPTKQTRDQKQHGKKHRGRGKVKNTQKKWGWGTPQQRGGGGGGEKEPCEKKSSQKMTTHFGKTKKKHGTFAKEPGG